MNDTAEKSPDPQLNAPMRAPTAQEIIESQVRQVIGITLRGLLVSAPGIQPHVLLNAISRQTGALIASVIEADLSTVVNLRKGFQDAFLEGVRTVPLMKAPPDAPGARS